MIRIQYPVKLVSEANRRDHWAKRASRQKTQRILAWAELRAANKNAVLIGPFVVTVTRIGPRKMDRDNNIGSMKATIDGIADWLGIDDGSDAVRWEYGQEKGPYGVRIEIVAKP